MYAYVRRVCTEYGVLRSKLCVMTAQQSRIAPIRFDVAKPNQSPDKTSLSFSEFAAGDGPRQCQEQIRTCFTRYEVKRDATVALWPDARMDGAAARGFRLVAFCSSIVFFSSKHFIRNIS